jgi:hypothetical protein
LLGLILYNKNIKEKTTMREPQFQISSFFFVRLSDPTATDCFRLVDLFSTIPVNASETNMPTLIKEALEIVNKRCSNPSSFDFPGKETVKYERRVFAYVAICKEESVPEKFFTWTPVMEIHPGGYIKVL